MNDAYDVGLLILRLVLGLTLAAHGYNKFFGGGRIPGTARLVRKHRDEVRHVSGRRRRDDGDQRGPGPGRRPADSHPRRRVSSR